MENFRQYILSIKFHLAIILSLLISGQSLSAQSTRLTGFYDLMESLKSGDRVRVIISYAHCKRVPDNHDQSPVPDAITGMDMNNEGVNLFKH